MHLKIIRWYHDIRIFFPEFFFLWNNAYHHDVGSTTFGWVQGRGGGGTQELKTYFFTEKKIATYCQDNIRTPSLRQILQWSKKLGVTSSDAKAVADRAMYRHTLGTFTPPPSYSSSKFKKKFFQRTWLRSDVPFKTLARFTAHQF